MTSLNLATTTKAVEFHCSDGTMVPQKYLCDGYEDCRDKSDEKHCDTTSNIVS